MHKHEEGDDDMIIKVMSETMAVLRVVAGAYPICPRCYVEAVIYELEQLLEGGLRHGEPLVKATFVFDTIGKTKGTA